MNKYNIVIIDDDYQLRRERYNMFLQNSFPEVEIEFTIIPIEYSRDLNSVIKNNFKRIDAFFIDAVLNNKETGWGKDNVIGGVALSDVLSTIEKYFGNLKIPPVFMISQHWTRPNMLTEISRLFSTLHTAMQPTRFFSLSELDDCVKSFEELDSNGKHNYSQLVSEREFIYNEIRKVKRETYVAEIPIHIVLVLAVTDEKEMAYKVFNINNDDILFNKKYGIYFAIAKVDIWNVALILQPEMGMAHAGIVATNAIHAFRPQLISMVGICAGRKGDVKLSDIIIPKTVFDYSRGKKNLDKTTIRALHEGINKNIASFIDNKISNNNELLVKVRTSFSHGDKPTADICCYTKPMATGTWVVNDPEIFEQINEEVSSECIALDMEAYAIALAAQSFGVNWIIIKSVQDFADGQKEKDELSSRKFAAFSSAKLLHECIPELMKIIG